MIESAWLRTFASFAEDANMSRAAERLHLTQPAVHGHLRKLAEELGVVLYRRAGRALALTRDGVEVAAYAREHAAREQALRARLAGEARTEPVVLAAGPGAIRYVVGGALPAFRRASKVRLEVRAMEAPAALLAVRAGEAQVGVGVVFEAPPDLVMTRLTSVEQVLVLPRAHPLARRRRVRLSELAGVPLVLPPEGRPQERALAFALRERGIAPVVGAVGRGWDLTVKLVELGMGLGVVNAFCEVPRSLVKRPLPELPSVPYSVFVRPDARPNALALARALVAATA